MPTTTMLEAFARRWILPVWFSVISILVANAVFAGNGVGLDTRIYRSAAIEALRGADPWATRASTTPGVEGFLFAAPPPTVIAAMPLTLVPEPVAVVVWAAVLVVAAVATVRALHLSLWWALFPPITDSVLNGNPDILVVALLVAGGRIGGAVAPLFKVYALVPLLAQYRWPTLAVAMVLIGLSLPLWWTYLPQVGPVTETLRAQSRGGSSAFGTLFVVPTILALLIVDRRSAGWLAVPAIWPYTQFHYSCVALPALGTFSAMAMALPIPGLPAVVVLAIAGYRLIGATRSLDTGARLSQLGFSILRRSPRKVGTPAPDPHRLIDA